MKNVKLALTLFAAFVGGVIAAPAISRSMTGMDGYMFQQKEFERKTVEVTFVTFANRGELLRWTRKNGIYVPNDMQSVSTYEKDGNKCTIYTIDPSKRYIPEQYGHELAHCVYGRWHEIGQ